MTPFMHQVAETISLGRAVTRPAVRPSAPKSVGVAVHEQVTIRARAGQLVSQANAVLKAVGEQITLTDEVGEGRLAFTLRWQNRRSYVATGIAGQTAVTRLHGIGSSCHTAVELDGATAVADLILLLVSRPPAGVPVGPRVAGG
ncbi:hypothetical protein [Nocardioides aquiterrae]|uniref:Uncharacterized protein n=1 Tax=Nocardioides aquiterrae TaxID=203799 RepID=A0ABN1URY2_9ACTN